MMLSDLIRKREVATATVATPATHDGVKGETVAKVATVAVANTLTAEEEKAIREWLAHIEETDPVTIGETLDKCRNVLDARRYFLKRSRE